MHNNIVLLYHLVRCLSEAFILSPGKRQTSRLLARSFLQSSLASVSVQTGSDEKPLGKNRQRGQHRFSHRNNTAR